MNEQRFGQLVDINKDVQRHSTFLSMCYQIIVRYYLKQIGPGPFKKITDEYNIQLVGSNNCRVSVVNHSARGNSLFGKSN